MNYKFTTVINKDKKWFVARCVELGVVSQGKNVEEAQKNLKEAVELYIEDTPKSKVYSLEAYALIGTLEIANV